MVVHQQQELSMSLVTQSSSRTIIMNIPLSEVVHFDICTHAPSTGAVTDADSTPTFDVYEEATDSGLLGATNFTKRTSLTGNYRGTFTASSANGFEVGKWYSVIASATVETVAAKKVCLGFMVIPATSSDGVFKTDISHFGGTAGTFASGIPETKVASIAADAITASAIATDAIGSSELAASAITEIQAGLSTLDAAGVRTAVGLASANLDTQLTAIDDFLDTEVAAIKAKTDNLPSDPADASDIAAAFATLNTKLDTIDDFLDTEIAAIKTVTDQFVAAQSEPSSVPAANATPLAKIAWIASLARNKITQTDSTQLLKADDGTTTIGTSTVSDDGTTATRGEWV
jgi:hypothetical protein